MLQDAIFVANNKIHIRRRSFADIRQRREIPPAIIIGRIISEVVPIVVGRIFGLERADRIVFSVAIKINAVGAGVAEHAVDYNFNALSLRRVD